MGTHKTSATLLNKRGRDGIAEIIKELKKYDDDFQEMLGNYQIIPHVGYEEGNFEYFSLNILYEKANKKDEAKVERLDCYLIGRTVEELVYAVHNFITGYKMKGQI